MAWLWNSYEEFRDSVRPVLVADHEGPLRAARTETLFEQHAKITKSLIDLEDARAQLAKLGFSEDPPKQDTSRLHEAYLHCEEAVWAGEELLLYDKRLAATRGGDVFCHQKDVIEREHWDRYASSRRIFREVATFVEAVDALVAAYHELVTSHDEYLSIEYNLPDSVRADFRLARDLLSVGLDEVSLLIAGRGLEGTLRHIAKDRRVTLEDKGKAAPASEVDFYHLIEGFGRLRWRGTGVPLLDKDAVALLHYLRSIRNAGAHPVVGGERKSESAREITKVTVETAGSLWKDATKAGARLVSTKVERNW